MMLLEGRQGLEGIRDLSQEPLSDGHTQERVPLPGRLGEQRPGGGEQLGKAVLPQQFVQPPAGGRHRAATA